MRTRRMSDDYTADFSGLAEIGQSGKLGSHLQDLASQVAASAAANGRVYDRKAGGPGTYSDSFTTVADMVPGGREGVPRVAVHVINTHPAAARIERAYGVGGRAAGGVR